MIQQHDVSEPAYKAYVSEPITRCPPREKGRIKNLVRKMAADLAQPPWSTKLYIPSLITSPEVRGEMLAEHVYLLDRIRVIEADYVLALADHTSFGIGGEVEMATSLGKPVVLMSRDEQLSRFLIGTPVNAVRAHDADRYFINYRDWRDLKPQLCDVLEPLLKGIKVQRREGLAFRHTGDKVRQLRLKKGLSVAQLAEMSGLREPQIRLLEKPFDEIRRELESYVGIGDLELADIHLSPHQLGQLTNIHFAALERLALALGARVGDLIEDERPAAKGPERVATLRLAQLERSRLASLEARAGQFDITFREFERLKPILIDAVLEKALLSTSVKRLETITEQEFLNGLEQVRSTLVS